MSVERVLAVAKQKGVSFWTSDGQLHYKAPKGALSKEEIESLKLHRSDLLALLDRAVGAENAVPNIVARARKDLAPVTFSQLAYWNLHELGARRTYRGVAAAIRLHGRLDVGALEESMLEIARRHEALRTRIVMRDGVPTQHIDESTSRGMEMDDLNVIPEPRRAHEATRIVDEFLMEPINVSEDRLFGVRLLRLRGDENVLVVAMQHIISDGRSLRIVVRDLIAGYVQVVIGRKVSLTAVPLQFADYAEWQRNTAKGWIEGRGSYWAMRLRGCGRLRFPQKDGVRHAQRGWASVPIHLGKELTAQLRERSRVGHTTIVMSVFTAYAACALSWCGVEDAVIKYQSDSRVSLNMESSVGYFASYLYIRMTLTAKATFVDILQQAVDEYCRAYEHADYSYLFAQLPRPEFTYSTFFNWVPQGAKVDMSELEGSRDAIRCSSFKFEHATQRSLAVDNEPGVLLTETDDEIVGGIHFPTDRFSHEEMWRFARNFMLFVKSMVRQPAMRIEDIQLCA